MSTLEATTLQGMWAALPVPWTHADQIDDGALRENVRRACAAGVSGVYTHGTTGEFYAQTPDEWQQVATATLEETKPFHTPVQIGCTALWTAEAIRRVTFAQRAGADAVQLAFPFWMQVTDHQAVRFLTDVASAAPGMPIVLYNTDRAKKPLTLELLARILDAGVPLIGCKGVRGSGELAALHAAAPHVQFFVGENRLAEWWPHGARGSYSSFVNACPALMLRYFGLCRSGDPEAGVIAARLHRMLEEYVVPRLALGLFDTALDRVIAASTGFLTGDLLLSRPPYDSASRADVDALRSWCAQHMPEFIREVRPAS